MVSSFQIRRFRPDDQTNLQIFLSESPVGGYNAPSTSYLPVNHTQFIMLRSIVCSAVSCFLLTSATYGQKEATAKAPERELGKPAPALSDKAEARMAFPSPYIRLLGIETALKKKGVTLDWGSIYKETAYKGVDAGKLSEKSAACFAMGVRFADGVIALMAKDAEKLKACADDIRNLAAKAGVKKEDIPAYQTLLMEMSSEEWAKVQFEVGMIQQEIAEKLDQENDRSISTIIASGAWLQGVRYATKLILKYRATEDLSNMLRAAPMAEMIASEIKKTKTDILSQPPVVASLKALAEIQPLINIGRDEVIPEEKLKNILKFATDTVDACLLTK